jgi:hypothetical protein
MPLFARPKETNLEDKPCTLTQLLERNFIHTGEVSALGDKPEQPSDNHHYDGAYPEYE